MELRLNPKLGQIHISMQPVPLGYWSYGLRIGRWTLLCFLHDRWILLHALAKPRFPLEALLELFFFIAMADGLSIDWLSGTLIKLPSYWFLVNAICWDSFYIFLASIFSVFLDLRDWMSLSTLIQVTILLAYIVLQNCFSIFCIQGINSGRIVRSSCRT